MTATNEVRHSSDGDLVRLLDDETGGESAEVSAHVRACGTCRARLDMLRRRSTLFTEMLAAVDGPRPDPAHLRPPARRLRGVDTLRTRRIWSHPALRAAAAVLLLAGVAAASPARAWILERVARLRGPAPESRTAPSQVPAPAPPVAPSSAVFFSSPGDELTIRLESSQAAGSLDLVGGTDPRSSAQILDQRSGEALLVLPSELRIQNSARSAASYRIVLSANVRRLRISVGRGRSRDTVLDVAPGDRHTIQLGTAAGRTP